MSRPRHLHLMAWDSGFRKETILRPDCWIRVLGLYRVWGLCVVLLYDGYVGTTIYGHTTYYRFFRLLSHSSDCQQTDKQP